MARLDIDFVLIDETVTDYGFRCLMSGAELADFIANPIMLAYHLRPTEYYNDRPKDDILLPIGSWYDIRVDGNRLLAKPDFDDDDPLAKRIESKVIKKYLNACSVWVEPIAVSDDENLKIPGQCGPTITKWGIRESSIVDLPGCRNALAIRDGSGKLVKLSSADKSEQPKVLEFLNSLLPTKNTSDMDRKLLAVKLGLPETATDAEIDAKLSAMTAAAAPNTKLLSDNKDLQEKLAALQTERQQEKVNTLVKGAVKDGKLSAKDEPHYIKLATADFETTKAIIDGMKPYTSIEGKLTTGDGTVDNSIEIAELMKLSGDDLYRQGKLERLKLLSVDHFKIKFKEAYGLDYKEQA